MGDRLGGSEFGRGLEAPGPCRGCLNLLSVDLSGSVECSGDPSERSPGSEECLAYVPLDIVKTTTRSRKLDEISRKAAVDVRRPTNRRSIHRRLSVVKEYRSITREDLGFTESVSNQVARGVLRRAGRFNPKGHQNDKDNIQSPAVLPASLILRPYTSPTYLVCMFLHLLCKYVSVHALRYVPSHLCYLRPPQ